MKHKLYNRLLSLALAVGLVIGMLPSAAAVDTVGGSAGQAATLGNGGEVSFTLPVKLYGDDGTDLSSAKTVNIPIVDGQTVQLPGEYTQGIETISSGNKTYKFSYVADSMNGSAVSELKAGMLTETKTSTEGGGWTDNWKEVTTTTTNTYIVWYGNKPTSTTASNIIASRSSSNSTTQRYERKWDWVWSDWYKVGNPTTTETPLSAQSNKKTIHFMYDKEGTLVPDKELTRDKIVTLNADGTYDLTLTVSGAAGSITNKQKLDVLFIVDKSNSMGYYMGEDEEAPKGQRRIDEVAKATKLLTGSLSGNQNIDVRYSVITFSGPNRTNTDGSENDAQLLQNWTDSATTVNNAVENIKITGATNYQAGIRKGISQLGSVRSDAQTVVIFLTDGLPTVRIGGGNGTNDTNSYNINAAVNEIKGMSTDSFYAIGAGPDFTSGSTESNNLNKLCNSVVADITDVFLVNDTDALQKAFEDIVGDTTSILCSNVTVTDTLSENVEIVTGGSGSGTPTSDDFTITVENQNGQQVVTGKGSVQVDGVTITASYNAETRQIVLDFPNDYQLKKGYTYKVTTKIQATEAAYEAYRNNGNSYPDTGDQGTGTHAGKAGLHTNNKATVDYTYNGKNYSAEYPMPVIQLKPGTLTITKQITGDLTEKQIAALEDSIKFEVELNGVKTSYPLSSFTSQGGNSYTMSIGGLSPNTQYTVTESGAEIPGYVLEANTTGTTGTIAKGGTATAAFTNKYTPDTGSLTITKTVVGLDSTALAELKDEISFVVKNSADEAVTTINKDSEDWNAAWNGSNFTYTIENLPTGTYTVTENGHNDITNYIWQTGETTATGTVVYNAAGTPAALTNTYTPADGYLTIKKEIFGTPFGDGRDTFNFKVTATSGKDEGKVWYFTIKGAGETEAIKLPVGEYKVKELSNINYACETSETIVTINNSNTEANPATVTFINKPSKTKIPTDSGGVKNVAEIKEGQITWKQEPENDEKPTPEPTHD